MKRHHTPPGSRRGGFLASGVLMRALALFLACGPVAAQQSQTITQLPQLTSPADGDLFVIEHVAGSAGARTSSLSASALAAYIFSRSGSLQQLTIGLAAEVTRAKAAEALLAPLASPALTGTPTAPTPATGDASAAVATSAFVKAQGYTTTAQAAAAAPVQSVAGRTGVVTLAVGDVSGTTIEAGNGIKIPVRVTPDPNGGQPRVEALTPGGGQGSALDGVAPLVAQGQAMAAQGAAQTKEAEGQVASLDKLASSGVDARAKVADLEDLKKLSNGLGAGSGPMVAKWLGDHGWVTKGSSDVEAYQGLAGYIATQMRQQGSGALRNQEMDRFQADLGNIQMAPEARLDAINRAQRMFGRIGDMGDVAANSRVAPQSRIDQIHAMAAQPYGDAPAGPQGGASGGPGQGGQAAQPQATAGPVQVQTPQQAMALPPGTVFVTPDGRRKVR